MYRSELFRRRNSTVTDNELLHQANRYISGFCLDPRFADAQSGQLPVCRDNAAALVAFLREKGGDARLVYGDFGRVTLLDNTIGGHAWVHLVLKSGETWAIDPSYCWMEQWRSGEPHPFAKTPFTGLYFCEYRTDSTGQLVATAFHAPH